MNVSNTEFCIYGSGTNVNSFSDKTIGVADWQISQCHQYYYLGVTLDECLTQKVNFNNTFKKFSHTNYQFG